MCPCAYRRASHRTCGSPCACENTHDAVSGTLAWTAPGVLIVTSGVADAGRVAESDHGPGPADVTPHVRACH